MSNRQQIQLTAPDSADDNVNLTEIWHALLENAKTILLVTSIIVLLAVLYLFHTSPLFTATGSLYTGGLKSSATAGTDPSDSTASSYLSYLATFQSATDGETQAELLTSPLLVQQAVLATGLNAKVANAGHAAPRYLFWHLFDHGSVAAYAPRATDLEALYANFSDPSVIAGKYEIVFKNAGDYEIRQNDAVVLTGRLGQPASGNGLNLLLQAQLQGFQPAPGSHYGLSVTNPVITAQSILSGPLAVVPGGTATLPSDVINLSFVWPNPYQGTAFINQLMTNYISQIVSWNSGAAGGMVDFITSQLTDVRAQLTDADKKLADYQQQTGILSPPDNARDVITQQSQYTVQRAQLQVQVMALQKIFQSLKTPEFGINPYLLSEASDTSLSQLSEKLAEDNASLQALRVQFTGNAPEVEALQAQVEQLHIAIRSMVSNELTQATTNLHTVDGQIAQFQTKIQNMPAQSLEVTSLTRSSNVLGQLYVLLMQKQQEAALSKAAAVSATRILTPAQLPLASSQPKPLFITAFALIIGLFGGVVGILGRRAISGRFETESEVRRLINLPIYGLLPKTSKSDADSFLINNGYGAFAEAIRIARNNLTHAIPGKRSKTVLITSAAIGDGKSTTAANLAKSLSEEGKRVLLIDGDLRMGQLHKRLALNESPGLSDWLITGEIAALQTPAGQRFAVLTAGTKPPNPGELINDQGLASILTKLKTDYDFIIFDSAPLPFVSDAVTLAKYADLTLSVIQICGSKYRDVDFHLNILAPLTKHHGIIINKIPTLGANYERGYGDAYQRREMLPLAAALGTYAKIRAAETFQGVKVHYRNLKLALQTSAVADWKTFFRRSNHGK